MFWEQLKHASCRLYSPSSNHSFSSFNHPLRFSLHLQGSSDQVVAPDNVQQAKIEFTGLNFQVESDSRYLASFIREATEGDSWLPSKVDDWVHNIKNLAGAARANPQRK